MLGSFAKKIGGASLKVAKFGLAIGAVSFAALSVGVSRAMGDLDAMGKFSDTVGVKMNDFAGLSLGAGLSGASTTDLENGLFRINRLVGEGNKKLLQFGIKKDTPTLEALQLIAEKIKNTESATERGAIAYSVLGKASKGLMPFLKAGSSGIQEFIDQNNKLGGAGIDRIGVAGIEEANDAMLKLKTIFKNVFSVIAIKVAPVITAITEQLMEMGDTGFSVSEIVNKGFELAVWGAGIFADVIHTVGLAFSGLKAIAVKAFSLVLDGIFVVAKGAKYLLGLLGKKVEINPAFIDFANKARQASDETSASFNKDFTAKTPSEKMKQFFDGVKSKSAAMRADMQKTGKSVSEGLKKGFTDGLDTASKMLEKLNNKIKFFGQDSTDIEIQKLKNLGIDTEQLSIAQKKLKVLEQEKKLSSDLKSKAQSVIESLKTPLQKQQEKLKELQTLFSKGLINQDQLDNASNKITATKITATKKNDFKLGSGARFGSQEAKNIIARSRNLGKQNGLDVAKKQLSLQEKMVASLKKLETKNSVEIVEFAF